MVVDSFSVARRTVWFISTGGQECRLKTLWGQLVSLVLIHIKMCPLCLCQPTYSFLICSICIAPSLRIIHFLHVKEDVKIRNCWEIWHLWHFGPMWFYKGMAYQILSPLLGRGEAPNQLPLPKDICTGIEQRRKSHMLLDRLEMDPRGFSVIVYSCKVQKRRETISQKIKF